MERKNVSVEKIITVDDLFLSTFLLMNGYKLLKMEMGNYKRVLFHFQATREIRKSILDFDDGELVDISQYMINYKILRSQMLSMKDRIFLQRKGLEKNGYIINTQPE